MTPSAEHSIRSVQRLGKNLVFGSRTHAPRHPPRHERTAPSREGPKDPKPKHTHVVFSFVQDGELRYVDPRTFGELYVSTPRPRASRSKISKFARLSIGGDGLALRKVVPELAHLGIDPFETRSAGTASPRSCAVARRHSRSSSPIRTSSRASATSTPTRSSSPPDCATTANPNRSRPSRSTTAPSDFRDPDRGDQARRLDAR